MNTKTHRNSVQPTVRNLRKNFLPLLLAVAGVVTGGSMVQATTYYSADFSSSKFTNGYLGGFTNGVTISLGQDGWLQSGTTNTNNPVTVTNGTARLSGVSTLGQTVNRTNPITLTAPSTIYASFDVNISNAHATGASFFTFVGVSGGTNFGRLYLRRPGGVAANSGFNVGIKTGAGAIVYSPNAFSFGAYKIVVAYNANTGANNDVVAVYVNPTGQDRGAWTSAISVTTAEADPAGFGSITLTGGATSGATQNTLTISKLITADSVSEALPAPAVPTSSPATAPGTGGFTANWVASSGATGYYLDVATDSGFTSFVIGYEAKNVGAVTSASVTGTFEGGTTLYYRVRAYNAFGSSANSETQTVGITAALLPTVSNGAVDGTVTWTNGPGWSPNNPISATNATVTFNGDLAGTTLTANNDSPGNFQLNSIVFANTGAGNVAVTGNPFQFLSNGTTNPTITFVNNTAVIQRVSNALQLDAALKVTQAGGAVSNSIIDGVVSGVAGLTKSGNGYVYMTSGNNSFGGGVTIENGTLVVENIGVAGSNSSLGTNGTLSLGGGSLTGVLRWGTGSVTTETTDKDIALLGSTGGGTIEVRGISSLLTLNGAIDTGTNASSRNLTLSGEGGNTVNGLISGNAGLRVNGSKTRTVILANGNNSFGGPVTIDGNISGQSYKVQVASIGNAGFNSPLGTNNTINIGTTVNSFNFLVWSNTVSETTDKTINLAGTVGGALIANKGPALLKFTAPVTATGVGVKTFYPDQDDTNGVTEFAGEIQNSSGGATALNKNGAGTLILSAANTFTGGFTLKGGTLELRHAQSLAAANALTFTINGTGLGRVKVAYSGAGSDLGNLVLLVDGTIDLGTDNTAQIRFGSATGWTADKILTVANSTGGGNLYILDTNNVALSQIKSLENPTYTASLAANGLLSFTAPTPANTAPTITSGGAFSVSENSTAVTTVAATDAEANPLTYSISVGADADKFWIDSGTGVLTFVSAPDYESPTDVGADNVYNVTVQVTDGALTGTKDIAVTVTNVSDSPADFKADWLAANGLPGSSSWNSDPNNVGYSLATAYAFGLSPSVNSGTPVALASSPAGSVKVVYLQKDNSGVSYTVKSGTDLVAGLNGTVTPVESAVQPSPGKSGYTQYEATYTPGGSKGFLKVQADVP